MKIVKYAALAALMSLAGTAHATNMYVIGASTPASTALLITTGAGNVTAVVISTGLPGDYCTWFDTNSANGIVQGLENPAYSTMTLVRLGDLFLSTGTSTNGGPIYSGATTLNLNPQTPFTKGLAIICSAARRVRVWWTAGGN